MTEETQIIAILSGVVIPILVGILAKLRAPAGIKSILNAGLSALAGALALIIPEEFDGGQFIVTFALTWVTSIATYYGLWKPTGVAPAVQQSTSSVGIG